jgi:hypothetical protein
MRRPKELRRQVDEVFLWEAGKLSEDGVGMPEFDLVLLGGGGDEAVGGIFVGPGPEDGLARDGNGDGENGPGGEGEFEPGVWMVGKTAFLPEAIDFHNGSRGEMAFGGFGEEGGFDAFRQRETEAEFDEEICIGKDSHSHSSSTGD